MHASCSPWLLKSKPKPCHARHLLAATIVASGGSTKKSMLRAAASTVVLESHSLVVRGVHRAPIYEVAKKPDM